MPYPVMVSCHPCVLMHAHAEQWIQCLPNCVEHHIGRTKQAHCLHLHLCQCWHVWCMAPRTTCSWGAKHHLLGHTHVGLLRGCQCQGGRSVQRGGSGLYWLTSGNDIQSSVGGIAGPLGWPPSGGLSMIHSSLKENKCSFQT